MNQYINGFSNNNAVNSSPIGVGSFYTQSYQYMADTVFSATVAISGGSGSITGTLINYSQWTFETLDISITGATTDGSVSALTVELLDNGTPIMIKQCVLTPSIQTIQLFNQTGLNYKSSGGGKLTVNIAIGTPGVVAANIYSNISGTVLAP
jgi:hypothetical protein